MACPLAALAQVSETKQRIGLLTAYPEDDPESKVWIAAFLGALPAPARGLVHQRWASGDVQRIQLFAEELINMHSDVILAATTPVVAGLLNKTTEVPIIFVNVADPIGSGFVQSLGRPAGNVTGFINTEASLGSKSLGLLREIFPRISHAWLMYNPDTAPYVNYYKNPLEQAASMFNIGLSMSEVHSKNEIEWAVARISKENSHGIIAMNDSFISINRKVLAESAALHRVPTISASPRFAHDGGLIANGTDHVEIYRRAAGYVMRILRGEKPGDLPVQLPTRFKMIINLPAANSLGLTVPAELLARADEIID